MMRIALPIAVLGAAALFLYAYGSAGSGDATAESVATPPPAEVGVIKVVAQDIKVAAELPDRINPARIAEVRPRVGGIILERVFEQGSNVNKGDVLFRIDPITYEAAVEAARAGVARAEAVLLDATQSESRISQLEKRKVSSTAELDRTKAARLQAEAELAAAKAELHRAEIDLSFTKVTAPITGRIGRASVTEGALVSAGGAEVMTTIQALDPVYADILQPVSELLALRRALESGALKELEPGVAQARLYLDDGGAYPHPGRLLFFEATVERTSGQVILRAEFPNAGNVLLPGMYVRVKVDQAMQSDALAVPSQAVQRDASGAAQVYVVTDENTAVLRPVTLGHPVGNRVVVLAGLEEGDRVVVDGFQKIRSGAAVKSVQWIDPTTSVETRVDDSAQAASTPASN
ncbi:efflux RND transporter periplasmic adaptor subunit [Rhodobacterales bacterium]|nr:efflux RND transporter periplasmic adaptor subunit [Rhodobacterales bacterium]